MEKTPTHGQECPYYVMTKYLHIKAGKNIYERLMDKGLRVEDISVFAGAAGGPKWIPLYHLDKYLMQHFLKNHEQTIDFYGTSIGAWRSLAYVLPKPVEALDRLAETYINQRYSIEPSWTEVSAGCYQIVEQTLNDKHEVILNPQKRRLHIGVTSASFEALQMSEKQLKRKFLNIAIRQITRRKSTNRLIQRVTYSNTNSILNDDGIAARHFPLSEENLLPALQASGAIPMIMNPVRIDGVDCWDGGIVDYHLDLKYRTDGVVFQPHFFSYIKPGWFDKYTRFRFSKHHHNTLLLYPSDEFVRLLPNQKLTETKDFYTYMNDTDKRIEVWLKAKELGRLLAEDFERLLDLEVFRESLGRF